MQACFGELEQKWQKCNDRRKGVKFGLEIHAHERCLTNLRFADDVVLFAQQRSDIEKMLRHLQDCSVKFGLQINFDKTKVLTFDELSRGCSAVRVGSADVAVLAETDAEKYLGRKLSLGEMHEVELDNRLAAGWAAFHKHKAELCSKFYCLADRLKLFNAVVTPVVLYACSTWALKKTMENKLHATWRRMLRYVFRTHRLKHVAPDSGPEPWVDYVRRTAHLVDDLAAKAGVESWVRTFRRRKWRFAGRLARVNDDRWSWKVLSWVPQSHRSWQRPRTRWSDSLAQFAGGNWSEVASDAAYWCALEHGFVENL